MITVWPFPDNL